FDLQQQVLYQRGELMPLTQKQGRLLALFLSEPDSIFSKEDILDHVWEGRAVSEQVVFQNISTLRNIIASDAIRTYSKRGYQWQIPLRKSDPDARPNASGKITQKIPALFLISTLVALTLIAAIFFLNQTKNPADQTPNTEKQTSVAFIPVEARFGGTLSDGKGQLNQNLAASFTTISSPISARAFLNSPYMERQKAGFSENKLLMSGILRWIQGNYFFTYHIQGQHRSWQAYHTSSDIQALSQTVIADIRLITNSRYFSIQNDALVTSELELLHNRNPENSAILVYLAKRHLNEANYDVAGAYIDKLAQLSVTNNMSAYLATAKWLQGERAIAQREILSAQNLLNEAASISEKAELFFIQSEITKAIAEISHIKGDFEAITRQLLQAASLARLANEPVKEIRAYTLLSIMAGKLGFADKKYEYLHHAKSLLADGNFDASHYMLVYYHFAMFAEDRAEKKQWYQDTLSRPITPENTWVFKSAAADFVDMLIEERKWLEAADVADRVPDPATAHQLKAVIYLAQGNRDRGLSEAREAFTLGRVNGDRWVGLPTAFILLENSITDDDPVKISEYKQYIKSNLKGRWKDWRREQLVNLGIE
ncbi:MAG: transcriptional regulator, partial [Kordiimonas sp.]